MSNAQKNNKSAVVAATVVVAVLLALVAVFTLGGRVFKSAPPAPAPQKATAAEEPAPKLHRRANWVYIRGDLTPHIEKLADFDIVVAPLSGADVASVKWLESRGCKVITGEPKFGGLLKDGRGEKTVGKIEGAVCWIGADFSDPSNRILAQENKKTLDALKEYAQAHTDEKVLVFAAGLPREQWKMFCVLMMRFGFIPSAGPADASGIYDYVHESAAAVPRPNPEG